MLLLLSVFDILSLMKEIAPEIVIDPNIRFGKPVVRGTRVPVELIVRELANGMEMTEICREYDLNLGQIRAVLKYAADRLKEEEVTSVQ